MTNRIYTYSFNELAHLIAIDKDIKNGEYRFKMTYNHHNLDKLLVVKVSPPKDKKGSNKK